MFVRMVEVNKVSDLLMWIYLVRKHTKVFLLKCIVLVKNLYGTN